MACEHTWQATFSPVTYGTGIWIWAVSSLPCQPVSNLCLTRGHPDLISLDPSYKWQAGRSQLLLLLLAEARILYSLKH